MPLLFLAAALLLATPLAAQPSADARLAGSRQAVVVRTTGWGAVRATVRRYARPDDASPWRPVGAPVAAVVGRAGLGVHPETAGRFAPGAPEKREGDGRAPAGIFPLTAAFGYAPAAEAGWIRLPYHASDGETECVDDGASPAYNRVVRRDTMGAAGWTSHEEMRRADGLYELGVVVGYNDPPVAGRGSCIFLHVWGGPDVATSGCTAMDREAMRALLAWLDPAARPVLVQLPEAEHARQGLAAVFP